MAQQPEDEAARRSRMPMGTESWTDADHRRRDDLAIPYQVRAHPLGTIAVWALSLVLFLRFFDTVVWVLLLLLGAATIASMLAPLARRLPWRHWISGLVTGVGFILAVMGVATLAGWLLLEPVREQLERWPEIEEGITRTVQSWLDNVAIDGQFSMEALQEQVVGWLSGAEGGSLIQNTIGGIGSVLVAIAMLGFGQLYFLSAQNERIVDGLTKLLPRREMAIRACPRELEPKLRWWLLGTVCSGTAVATVSSIGFTLVGLDFALPLALLAGLAEFVPVFGPASVFLLAFLVAATQGPTEMLGVAILWLIVQTLDGYVFVPLIMRQAVHMPPLITLFSVIFWAGVFGPLGLVLSVPLNLTIWTIIRHFYLRPLHAQPPPTGEDGEDEDAES